MQGFQNASFIKNFFATSFKKKAEAQVLPSIHQPFISLFAHHFVFASLQPLLSTCTYAVCANRRRAERSLLRSPCSRLRLRGILRCSFLRLPMFDLTVWARKTTAYSTAQRAEYRFRNPKPCSSLLLVRQLCYRKPTRGRPKFLHIRQFTHSMMDNILRFRYSCISGVGFRHSESTILVLSHMHASKFEPTHFPRRFTRGSCPSPNHRGGKDGFGLNICMPIE